jgi:hypothetical protein
LDGTLTWTVRSIGDCENDRRVYIVLDSMQGTLTHLNYGSVVSEEPRGWARLLEVPVYADSVRVPHWKQAIPRVKAGAAAPDTLSYHAFAPVAECVGWCISGSYAVQASLLLVRGRGVVSRHYYYGAYSNSGSDSEKLTRLEG